MLIKLTGVQYIHMSMYIDSTMQKDGKQFISACLGHAFLTIFEHKD